MHDFDKPLSGRLLEIAINLSIRAVNRVVENHGINKRIDEVLTVRSLMAMVGVLDLALDQLRQHDDAAIEVDRDLKAKAEMFEHTVCTLGALLTFHFRKELDEADAEMQAEMHASSVSANFISSIMKH